MRRWTGAQDALLMDLIADGRTFSQAARVMRMTKNAVIGRFKRLAARMGAQAV